MTIKSTLIKYVFYPIISILAVVFTLLLIVLFQDVSPDQQLEWQTGSKVYRNLDSEFFATKFDSLYEEYGQLKVLPEGYELQALIALSMYPELKDVKITFEFVPIFAPLESNFDIPTLIRSGKNRTYRILLSNDSTTFFKDALFTDMPFDAQVAMLTHELGHTVYYHQLNLFQIGRWCLNYVVSQKFQDKHESDTDRMVIHRGLGWQLYESSSFFINHFASMRGESPTNLPTEAEINDDDENDTYLDRDDILDAMREIPAYQSTLESFDKKL